MEHDKYWAERFEQLTEAELRKADDLSAEMVKEYRQTAQDLNDDIQRWYARFAAENKMSLAEARRVLNARERAEFQWSVEEYIKRAKKEGLTDAYVQRLKNASARVHIDRLEAIRYQMAQHIERLAAKGNARLTDVLRDIYPDAHLRTAYEVQKKMGFDSFARIPETDVERILKKPWVSDGLNFSDRIWRDKDRLLSTLQGELTRGLIRGEPYSKIAQRIAGRMNVAMSAASRLVETEAAFFSSKGQLDAFRDLGVEQYEFVATLDSKTSETCREMDGKVLPLSEFNPGITAPPLHCHCRSTTCPYFDDEFTENETRAARDPETGKTLQAPAPMTYSEWADVYVDKTMNAQEWATQKIHVFKTERLEAVVNAAKTSVVLAEAAFKNIPNDTYSGIWKDDVQLGDWEAKKASVPAKLKYFEEQIAVGNSVSKFEMLTDELLEFDTFGKMYTEKKAALKTAKEALDNAEDALYMHLNGGRRNPAKDPYTEKRRNNAFWFKQKSAADKRLRSDTGVLWQKLSYEEREALYDYTYGSGGFNRPLAGFEKPFAGGHESGWEEKYKKGVGNVWINYEGKGKKIRAMTEAIRKSSYDFDIWLQRGCGNEAMDSFFGLNRGTFAKLGEAGLESLIEHTATMDNFISTAACKGSGFDTNPVILNIYAPKGTNMIYAEPFSHYGLGGKLQWDGKSEQKSFGREFEVIIQRGAHYKVTKIERKGGKTFIDLEIHPEKGYNLYQQDVSEWKGSRKNFHGENISIEDEKKGG